MLIKKILEKTAESRKALALFSFKVNGLYFQKI